MAWRSRHAYDSAPDESAYLETFTVSRAYFSIHFGWKCKKTYKEETPMSIHPRLWSLSACEGGMTRNLFPEDATVLSE